jgi:hypothetical protein
MATGKALPDKHVNPELLGLLHKEKSSVIPGLKQLAGRVSICNGWWMNGMAGVTERGEKV